MLNTFRFINPAPVADANGTTDKNVWFKMMDAEVYDSISFESELLTRNFVTDLKLS